MYLAPSGVQKERIEPEHIFVLPFAQSSVPKPGSQRDFIRIPSRKVSLQALHLIQSIEDDAFGVEWILMTQGLKESACTPLFWNAFTLRDAGACIHTHSQHAVLLTLLLGKDADAFRISHQEMIKGVRIGGNGKTLRFFDTLTVPIIENTADEEDLTDGMREAMEKYPEAAAILVRRHGVYVWGTFTFFAQRSASCCAGVVTLTSCDWLG